MQQPGTLRSNPVGHDPGPPPRSSRSLRHPRREKYADPRNLPSYPSPGLKDNAAAASAAALLGWAHKEPTQPRRKAASLSSASAAAIMARDNHILDHPRGARPGSPPDHSAAVVAAGSAQRHALSPKPPPSKWGGSAANLAFESAVMASPKPKPEPPATATKSAIRHGSTRAAAVSLNTRHRSQSSPQVADHTYPDQANAAANALAAATIAHRPTSRTSTSTQDAGSTPYTMMDRRMFTANPPVQPEVDEKRHADSLHTSAVAIAKQMYVQQQKIIDARKHTESDSQGLSASPRQHGSGSAHTTTDDQSLLRFPNLQEAAYRLAQERLAKLHEEHQKNRDFREYYGPPGSPSQRSKLGSIRGKLTRRRSSSDGELLEDRRSFLRLRRQTSGIGGNLPRVDEDQRSRDREAVFAVAQRNVRAQLEGMDQKVLLDTGRVAPRRLTEWELKAHAAAQARSDARRDSNFGKVDIGGGKYMDQFEVDNIAARRVKPLIDDLDQRAEVEREKQIAAKLDEEHRREEAEKEKQREKEIQDIYHKLKEQDKEEEKERKAEAKQESKARKEEEKAAKEESKRQQKEEKRKSKEHAESARPISRKRTSGDRHQNRHQDDNPPISPATPTTDPKPRRPRPQERTRSSATHRGSSPPLEEESPSPTSRVRTWFKTRFSRGRTASSGSGGPDENGPAKRGFIGGIRLHRERTGASDESADRASGSTKEIALARAERENPAANSNQFSPSTAVNEPRESSDLSSGDTEFMEARDRLDSGLSPPPRRELNELAGRDERGSTPRGSRFSEMINE